MFKKEVLPSGLRILTAPMSGTNTVTVLIFVGTGSNFETKQNNGISHFLEHMFFKGTTLRPSKVQISTELDGMGAVYNAFTSSEYTGYFAKVGYQYFDRAFDIVTDIFLNSTLPDEEIERERGVIIEEMHMRHDDPQSRVAFLWEKLLYGDQPAGWETLGEEPVIRVLKRNDFMDYFHGQYVARNTAVIVAGNIKDEQAVVEKIKKTFSGLRDGEPRKQPKVVEAQVRPGIISEDKKTDQTNLIIGFRGFGKNDPRIWPASLLATVLGGGMSSRMFLEIREELGLAYNISTGFDDYSTYGYFATGAGVPNDKLDKAIPAILGEYKKVRDEVVPQSELNKARDFVKGTSLIGLESSSSLATFIGGEEILTGKPMTIEEVFAKLDAVTPESLQAAARDIIKEEGLNLALVGPKNDEKNLKKLLVLS
ncbi:MAG: pitrilysin family protein [bacterium]|nr:pitrilysin family protein [bacterium]